MMTDPINPIEPQALADARELLEHYDPLTQEERLTKGATILLEAQTRAIIALAESAAAIAGRLAALTVNAGMAASSIDAMVGIERDRDVLANWAGGHRR